MSTTRPRVRTPQFVTPLDAWNAARPEPPHGLDGGPLLAALVPYAILAPSSHNTQPWRFVLRGDTLDLHADPTRALPVCDPSQRELVISCGAALGTLAVAARAAGRALAIARAPDLAVSTLLARITLGDRHAPTDVDRARFEAIPHRRTTRQRYVREPVPAATAGALVAAAGEAQAWLECLDDPERRDRFAALVAEADAEQGGDPAFRRELAAWVHANHSSLRDGMPGYALNLGNAASIVGPWVMRLVEWGDREAEQDRAYTLCAPLVAILGTASDETADLLEAGEALARVTLTATALGLKHAYLNQPIELPALRRRTRALLPTAGLPQLALRFGRGTEVLPTPRRPVGEVLTVVD